MLVSAGMEGAEHPQMATEHGLEVFVNLSASLRGKCHVFTFENRKLFTLNINKVFLYVTAGLFS